MTEKLIAELAEFGLSLNQARVYASIIVSNCKTAGQIAEITGIHPQDVYKNLSKLEQKGLVLITLRNPITFEPVDPEKSLQNLIIVERKKSVEKTHRMYNSVHHIKSELTKSKEIANPNFELILMKTGTSPSSLPKNVRFRADNAWKNLREEYDLVTPQGSYPFIQVLREKLPKIRKSVKVKILIIRNDSKIDLAKAFEEIMPPNINYAIKETPCEHSPTYVIIDSKELWIDIRETKRVLVTSFPSVVSMARREFDMLWNNRDAQTISAQSP